METVFNFFYARECSNTLSSYLEINKRELESFLVAHMHNVYIAYELIKNFDVDLLNIHTSKVRVKCKHVTTSYDELESFKRHGFLHLDEVMELDTPMSRYFRSKGLVIKPSKQILTLRDKDYFLFKREEDCKFCSLDGCKHVELNYRGQVNIVHKNIHCNYRSNIMSFIASLYHDKGEIEFHIIGSDETITKYSCVKECPEIYRTLDNAFLKIFNEDLQLQKDWKNNEMMETYILEVDLLAHDLEFVKDARFLGDYELDRYLDIFNMDDDDFENLSELEQANFCTNIYLIKKTVKSFIGSKTGWAQLLPHVKLDMSDVSYKEYEI